MEPPNPSHLYGKSTNQYLLPIFYTLGGTDEAWLNAIPVAARPAMWAKIQGRRAVPRPVFRALVEWIQELVEDIAAEEDQEWECRSLIKGACLAPQIRWRKPYVRARVGWKMVNGKRVDVYEYIHRLVCWSHWGWESEAKGNALHKGKDGRCTCRKREGVVVCVNYKHLEWGDASDNAQDREATKKRRRED
jgi:hypothetical protein